MNLIVNNGYASSKRKVDNIGCTSRKLRKTVADESKFAAATSVISTDFCRSPARKGSALTDSESNRATKVTEKGRNLLENIRLPIYELAGLLTGSFTKHEECVTAKTDEQINCIRRSPRRNAAFTNGSPCRKQASPPDIQPACDRRETRSLRRRNRSESPIVIDDDEEKVVSSDSCESDTACLGRRPRRTRRRSRSVPPSSAACNLEYPILERLTSLRDTLHCAVGKSLRTLKHRSKRNTTQSQSQSQSSAISVNAILSDWRVRRVLLRIEKELSSLVRVAPHTTVVRTAKFALTANDLDTLAGSNSKWLNDAVINAYLNLVTAASVCTLPREQSTTNVDATLSATGKLTRSSLSKALDAVDGQSIDFQANKSRTKLIDISQLSLSPSLVRDSSAHQWISRDTHRAQCTHGVHWPRVYAFSSFMFAKLSKTGYDGVQRWTKKLDLFTDYDILLFPVNLPAHWTLAVADLRKRTLRFYDPLMIASGCKDDKEGLMVLRTLFGYLEKESLKRTGVKLDASAWRIGSSLRELEKRALQHNGSDCGVYVCKYAEAGSRDAPLYFDAEEGLNGRRQILCELMLLATLHSADCHLTP